MNSLELLDDRVQSFEVIVHQVISPPKNELEFTDMPIENAQGEIPGNGEVKFTGKVLGDLLSFDCMVAAAVIWAPEEITIWGTHSTYLYVYEGAEGYDFCVYVDVDELNFSPDAAAFNMVFWGMTEISQ